MRIKMILDQETQRVVVQALLELTFAMYIYLWRWRCTFIEKGMAMGPANPCMMSHAKECIAQTPWPNSIDGQISGLQWVGMT